MSKKKVLSVVLTAAMITSVAVTSAISTSADDIRGTVYFDANGPLAGAQRNTYYCYMWGSDGSGNFGEWNTKELKMTKVSGEDNLFSYDVPKTNKNGDTVNADLVIFSALGKGQTYDTTFSESCFGDTAYVTDEVLENPVDSAQTCLACAWKNNPQEGSHISITSTGKVQGVGILSTETAESITDAFIAQYKAGMEEGKTGYDNPDLVTDAARADFIAKINEIIANAPEKPTQGETPTEGETKETPTEKIEVPTEKATEGSSDLPVGGARKRGLPLPATLNLPAKDTNPDATYDGWDGYYNIYYFEAPTEWITEHKDAKESGWEIGFYWFTGSMNNGDWPGEKATKLEGTENIYYAFAPTYANSIIWNNGISDKVEENKKFKLQTQDTNVDDSALNTLADIIYEEDDSIDGGVSVAGCLAYVSSVEKTVNGLTGDEMDVYKVAWKFFDPRTGETTTTAFKDEDGNYVTYSNDEYEKIAVNPYYDMDYTYVNKDAEVPTAAEVSTLPPAPTDGTKGSNSGTNATNAAGNNNASNTTGGSGATVNTAEGATVVVLGTVLVAAMGIAFVARKRKESEEV